MSKFDAVAVFGTRLQDNDTFLPFVYQELDRAANLVNEGLAPQVIFCGSHWAGEEFRGVRECDRAEEYFKDVYPQLVEVFLKEGRSTCVQENWLFMKIGFPSIRRIYHVTIEPFLPRMAFTGDWIYGNDGIIKHEALPWPPADFPHESQLLRDATCIFTVYNHMQRGDHGFLLQQSTDESRWRELWWAHGKCLTCYPK